MTTSDMKQHGNDDPLEIMGGITQETVADAFEYANSRGIVVAVLMNRITTVYFCTGLDLVVPSMGNRYQDPSLTTRWEYRDTNTDARCMVITSGQPNAPHDDQLVFFLHNGKTCSVEFV